MASGSDNTPIIIESSDEGEYKRLGETIDISSGEEGIEPAPEPAGPFTAWEYQFKEERNANWWKCEDFPPMLFPPHHLDQSNSGEEWGEPHRGYTHVPDVEFRAAANWAAEGDGNCYFSASKKW